MTGDDTQPTTPPVYQEPPSGIDMGARRGSAKRAGKVEPEPQEFDADAARLALLKSIKSYGRGDGS